MEVNQRASSFFRSLWGCSAPAWDQSTQVAVEGQRGTRITGVYRSHAALTRRHRSRRGAGSLPIGSPGSPRPLLRRFTELCGSSKGPDLILWAQLWLPQELCVLHSSQSYSVLPGDTNLKASTSEEVTFALVPVSTLQPPCRIRYRTVTAPGSKFSTTRSRFQQGFYVVSHV